MLNKFGKNRRKPLITIKNGSNIAEIRINCKDKLIINTLEPKGNEKNSFEGRVRSITCGFDNIVFDRAEMIYDDLLVDFPDFGADSALQGIEGLGLVTPCINCCVWRCRLTALGRQA